MTRNITHYRTFYTRRRRILDHKCSDNYSNEHSSHSVSRHIFQGLQWNDVINFIAQVVKNSRQGMYKTTRFYLWLPFCLVHIFHTFCCKIAYNTSKNKSIRWKSLTFTFNSSIPMESVFANASILGIAFSITNADLSLTKFWKVILQLFLLMLTQQLNFECNILWL